MRSPTPPGAEDDVVARKGLARLDPLLLGLAAAAALLRFVGLGDQAYWGDEAHTAFFARLAPDEILPRMSEAEGTPPLYYLGVWAWMQLVGNGEATLRAISALAGTATVPVAYLAATEFVSRRAALATAALVALSPALIWYSQEARAYALAVLLGALSLLTFGRALQEPTRGRLAAWALVSGAAAWTQYTAALLVVPEAAWLLLRSGAPRRVLAAVAGVGAIAAPAGLLLLEQNANGATPEWIKNVPRDIRGRQLPEQFLLGYGPPLMPLLAAAALVLALALWLLARRASADERRRAALPAALGVAVIAPPLVLSAVPSLDYLVTRNVLLALVPFAIVVAAGLTCSRAGRLGAAGLAGLLALAVVVTVWVAKTPTLQRPNWRDVAESVGPAAGARVVVVPDPVFAAPLHLHYLDSAELMPRSVRVAEIVVVQVDGSFKQDALDASSYSGLECWWGSFCAAPELKPLRRPPVAGFALAERRQTPGFVLSRYRSAEPRQVLQRRLVPPAAGAYQTLLQRPPG